MIYNNWRTSTTLNPTNIQHKLGTSEGLSWGYSGEGPKDFALNILFHFSGGDSDFAKKFGCDFCSEVVSRLSQKSGVLPASLILSWVEPRLKGKIYSKSPKWDWA